MRHTFFTGLAVLVCSGLAFAVLATLNSGGYRYGASDQAFYIPAALHAADPSLFPKDAALIGGQSRLTVLDELLAFLNGRLGLSLPAIFLTAQILTLTLLFAAYASLGGLLYRLPWTIGAFLAAETLRHRITKTGVNTLEGYWHPRVLTFALGLLALTFALKRRVGIAAVLLVIALLLHPTTACWFGLWIVVALMVNEPRWRTAGAGLVALAGLGAIALLWRGVISLAPMDAAWSTTLAGKDYIYPTAWAFGSWAINLSYALIIALVYRARQRAGVLQPWERGLVFGCVTLIAIFLLTLPLVALRSAFIIQFQVSRVFWMADLLAVAYAIWWAAEGGRRSVQAPMPARLTPSRAIAVCLVLVAVAGGRGLHSMLSEHADRAVVQVDLPPTPWTDVSRWIAAQTPKDAHLLADPGHAWKYGASLRVSAARDVFLESQKDTAMGMYDRPTAMRVAERDAALGSMDALTADRARALAARYDLDYLVTERALPLPAVYRNDRFTVYQLAP